MSYDARFVDLCELADLDELLAFLKGIFHARSNQKLRGSASDYLRDDDERDELCSWEVSSAASRPAGLKPARGFDDIVAGFQKTPASESTVAFVVECLTERPQWVSAADVALQSKFAPFNGVHFEVGDYGAGDVTAKSVHHGDGLLPVLHLEHELIDDDDSTEEYDFAHALKKGDQVTLRFSGERLDGERLYLDLKAIVFARWLNGLVDELLKSPAFREVPKAFPFTFSVGVRDGWSMTLRELSEPGAHRVLEATPPTPEERFAWHGWGLGAPLAALIEEHPRFGKKLIARFGDQLKQSDYARALSTARFLFEHVREEAIIALKESGDLFAHESASVFAEQLTYLAGLRELDEQFAPVVERTLKRAHRDERPVVRMLALEAEAGRDSDAYVRAVAACVPAMSETYGERVDENLMILERLKALGTRAILSAPLVEKKMDALFSESPRINASDIFPFAQALYDIGAREVPRTVELAAERDRHHFAFYRAWQARGPKARWRQVEDGKLALADALRDDEVSAKIFAEKLDDDERVFELPASPARDALLRALAKRWRRRDLSRAIDFLEWVETKGQLLGDLLGERAHSLSRRRERVPDLDRDLQRFPENKKLRHAATQRALEEGTIDELESSLAAQFPDAEDTRARLRKHMTLDDADADAVLAFLEEANGLDDSALIEALHAPPLSELALARLLSRAVDVRPFVTHLTSDVARLAQLYLHDPALVLDDEDARAHLSALIIELPGNATEVFRGFVFGLSARGLQAEISALCDEVKPDWVIGAAQSVAMAFENEQDADGGAQLFARLAQKIDRRDPTWTLAMSNAAALYSRSDNDDAALETLDRVIAQDTARFEEKRDEFSEQVIGDSVASQAARAFWRYFDMAHFNRACVLSRLSRFDEALASLKRAVAGGHYTEESLAADDDLAPLRAMPVYREVLDAIPRSESDA